MPNDRAALTTLVEARTHTGSARPHKWINVYKLREGHEGARGGLILPNDAAQIRGNVTVAGMFKCSLTIAARQIVSVRWWKGGRAEAPVLSSDVSFWLDQKTATFKVASSSRRMQWSALTEEEQKNQIAQTEFHFTKTITIMRGGNYYWFFASTSALHCSKRRQTSRWPPPADQCSGVSWLKKSKRINLRKQSFTSQKQ